MDVARCNEEARSHQKLAELKRIPTWKLEQQSEDVRRERGDIPRTKLRDPFLIRQLDGMFHLSRYRRFGSSQFGIDFSRIGVHLSGI